MHCPTDRTAHTITFDGSFVDHWLEGKIVQTTNASAMQACGEAGTGSEVLVLESWLGTCMGFARLGVGAGTEGWAKDRRR